MKLLTPAIFDPFPEVAAGMSLVDEDYPGRFSMLGNGVAETDADHNRVAFAKELGFPSQKLAVPIETQSDIVHPVRGEYHRHESDALITEQAGWLLGITTADCVPILLYNPDVGCYAAIHSGWRGSAQNITGKTIGLLTKEYSADPAATYAWIGPAASGDTYEVGFEVINQFNPRYSQVKGDDTWLFDNKSVVKDQLINSGIGSDRIEVSGLDTITNVELHSARREGESSGRMLAAIGVAAS